MKHNTIRNSAFNVVKTIGTFVFPVITFSYISRIFLAEGIGRINFAKSFIGIFSLIAMLGIRYYGIRECAKRRDDKEKLSRIFSELLGLNLISTLFAYIALFVFTQLSAKTDGYRVEIGLYSITMLLTVISIEWLYIAVEDYGYLAIRSIIIQVITLLAVFALIRKKEDIYLYIAIQVIANCTVNVMGLIHARKYIRFVRPQLRDMTAHIKPVLCLFIVMMFIQIFTDMDTVMLGYLADDVQVGLYSAAYKMSSVICSFVSAVTTVIMPRMAYVLQNDEESKANELLKNAIQFILMVGIPLSIGSCIFSRNFILILSGEDFLSATPSSMILALRTLLSPVNGMLLTHYLIQKNKDKEATIITAAAAVFNIGMNAVMIPILGAVGTSISTVCAEIIEMVFIFIFVRKYLDIKAVFAKSYQYLLSVIPVAIVAIAAQLFISHVFISIIVGVVIAAPVYFVFLYLFKNEYLLMGRDLIRNILGRNKAE